MQTRVCFLYPWATLGGVERMLLSRALAFQKFLPSVRVEFYFLRDSGGLAPLQYAIRRYDLEATTSIVHSLEGNYDCVFIIDCPQAIELCVQRSLRYVVECHTSYTANRAYLAKLPDSCEKVITPSSLFRHRIEREFPNLCGRVGELRNFVPWDIDISESGAEQVLPSWARRPILFLGRLDRLKDPVALLDALQILETRRPEEFMALFCGPKSPDIDIDHEIHRRTLGSLAVTLPAIPFASAGRLLMSVSRSRGIFVSPSKGESFGLSAAEAICSLVPVVLSDIKAHLNLIDGCDNEFTYPLGDANQLSARIESVFDNYDVAYESLTSARSKLSASSFIEDWMRIVRELGFAK